MTAKATPRITVKIDTNREGYTREEWAARQHVDVDIKLVLPPTAKGYTRDELLATYRWYAGFLARVALYLHHRVINYYRYVTTPEGPSDPNWHRCTEDRESGPCGVFYEEGIVEPRACLTKSRFKGERTESYNQSPPWVSLMVPVQHAKGWAKNFERVIAAMLANDLAPLSEPKPEEHAGALLGDAPTTEREERTR